MNRSPRVHEEFDAAAAAERFEQGLRLLGIESQIRDGHGATLDRGYDRLRSEVPTT